MTTNTQTPTQRQLERLTQTFIKEAVPLIYENSVNQANELISNGFAQFARNGFKVSNGNGHTTRKVRATGTKKTKTKTKRSKKNGAKRTSEQLMNMQLKIFTAIKSAGKKGISPGDIQEATGFTPQAMSVPIKKLLVGKKLRKRGERNKTIYFTRKNASPPTASA